MKIILDSKLSKKISQKDILITLEKLNLIEMFEEIKCPCCNFMMLRNAANTDMTTWVKINKKIKILKEFELIRDDYSLTPQGKTILYAMKFDVPIRIMNILVILYVHRTLQKSLEYTIPLSLNKFSFLFVGHDSNTVLSYDIKCLIKLNLIKRSDRHSIIITDFAFSMLSRYEVDILEIESVL